MRFSTGSDTSGVFGNVLELIPNQFQNDLETFQKIQIIFETFWIGFGIVLETVWKHQIEELVHKSHKRPLILMTSTRKIRSSKKKKSQPMTE